MGFRIYGLGVTIFGFGIQGLGCGFGAQGLKEGGLRFVAVYRGCFKLGYQREFAGGYWDILGVNQRQSHRCLRV